MLPDNFFTNKVILITGSSMGIGKSLAVELAGLGACVVLNGRNKERLDHLKEELSSKGFNVIAEAGDVSKFEDCQRIVNKTIETQGKIDILINNAGLIQKGVFADVDPDSIQTVVNTNTLGSIYPTKAALPHIIASKGSIVFISSVGALHGIPTYSSYSASKMALTAFAESLKAELAETGIHIGINYVDSTQNDPNKKIMNGNGELTSAPEETTLTGIPAHKVARQIIRNIQKKKFKSVHSPMGKLNALLIRLLPGLVGKILSSYFMKIKKGKEPFIQLFR